MINTATGMTMPQRAVQLRAHQSRRILSQAILLLPSLAAILLFFLGPLAVMLVYSFFHFEGHSQFRPALSAENYLRFLLDDFYRGILFQTLSMAFVVSVLCTILGFPLAYTLARSESRWKGLLTALIIVPLMSSVVVRSYGWTILLANGGPIRGVMELLELPATQLIFTRTGTIIALTQVLLPFFILTVSGTIQQIDPRLEQAVRSLGGGARQIFLDVLLPLSLPGVMAGSLLVFVLTIGAYATPRLVGGARTITMATMVYEQATAVGNWPFAAALSFILIGLILSLMLLQWHLLKKVRPWVV